MKGKYTLLIASMTIAFYFIFSASLLYIPRNTIYLFGFNFLNPLSILTYTFVHVGPSHLVGNMLLLLAVGVIAESRLNGRDYFTVYFVSGAAAAVVFGMLNISNVLVGASAAISGLLMAAFIIDMRKAFFYTLAALLFSSLVALPLAEGAVHYLRGEYSHAESEITESLQAVGNEKLDAEIALTKTSEQIDVLNRDYTSGEISEAEYEASVSAAAMEQAQSAEQLNKLRDAEAELINKLSDTITRKDNLAAGKEREAASNTDVLIHLAGAATALGYMAMFRKDLVWGKQSRRSQSAKSQGRPKRPSRAAYSKRRSKPAGKRSSSASKPRARKS